ncbi:hypothetical protein [Methylobacterium sp. Leaf94]|uniref:hypothetical protein n=1 Tax=Methylobacterium sp. Leaf94 TaxID=1736250 RepID=UPI0012E3D9D0|nr:hypothetical protein [Methylobacterium sp. Leaf94]
MRKFIRFLRSTDSLELTLPLLSIAGLFITVLVFSILLNNKDDIDAAPRLGQYGDFFGGFSNPLLTFLTFLGVLYTVYLQREALNISKEEAKKATENLRANAFTISKQNFEATLFQMINLHDSIVSATITQDGNFQSVQGRVAFGELLNKLSRYYTNNQSNTSASYINFYN